MAVVPFVVDMMVVVAVAVAPVVMDMMMIAAVAIVSFVMAGGSSGGHLKLSNMKVVICLQNLFSAARLK